MTSPVPGRRRSAPTIFDVAERAGVSHQTVSRVINGDPTVREQNRAKVTAAVLELKYRPRAAARALAGGRSHALGLVTGGDTLYGPSSTAIGFERAARAAGYHVVFSSLPEDPSEADLKSALVSLLSQDVDAILVVAFDSRVLAALASLTVPVTAPVVVANAAQPEAGSGLVPTVAAVAIDQAEGARLAMNHLLAAGHRRIVHLSGPAISHEAQVRAQTYTELMVEHGLEPVVLAGDWTPDSGFAAAQQLDPNQLDAIFVANDQMALGVLHAFADAGIRVPEQVAVVGFDDLPEAAHFSPPLTTVRQDYRRLGESLLAAVRSLIEDEPLGATVIAPELVVRRSS